MWHLKWPWNSENVYALTSYREWLGLDRFCGGWYHSMWSCWRHCTCTWTCSVSNSVLCRFIFGCVWMVCVTLYMCPDSHCVYIDFVTLQCKCIQFSTCLRRTAGPSKFANFCNVQIISQLFFLCVGVFCCCCCWFR